MKKLLFSLLLILGALVCKGQEICLPESVVDSIILDLASYDKLIIDYNEANNKLLVYEAELAHRTKLIKEAHITVEEYIVLVEKLQEKIELKDDKLITAKKTIRKLRLTHVLRTIAEIAVVVLLIAI